MNNTLLATRLIAQLNLTHAKFGVDVEPLVGMLGDRDDVEIHQLSPLGVLAFIGDYVLVAWPDDEMELAGRRALRLLARRVKARGFTRHMVHPLNFRSVKLTRKLGAVPVGVDDEGFVHYILRAERFCRHG